MHAIAGTLASRLSSQKHCGSCMGRKADVLRRAFGQNVIDAQRMWDLMQSGCDISLSSSANAGNSHGSLRRHHRGNTDEPNPRAGHSRLAVFQKALDLLLVAVDLAEVAGPAKAACMLDGALGAAQHRALAGITGFHGGGHAQQDDSQVVPRARVVGPSTGDQLKLAERTCECPPCHLPLGRGGHCIEGADLARERPEMRSAQDLHELRLEVAHARLLAEAAARCVVVRSQGAVDRGGRQPAGCAVGERRICVEPEIRDGTVFGREHADERSDVREEKARRCHLSRTAIPRLAERLGHAAVPVARKVLEVQGPRRYSAIVGPSFGSKGGDDVRGGAGIVVQEGDRVVILSNRGGHQILALKYICVAMVDPEATDALAYAIRHGGVKGCPDRSISVVVPDKHADRHRLRA
eukprot:m.253040 g.253040  ORF g.253040 m.253040 type:complete len:409 (-) comp18130_c0_seq1:1568-2794(-)